MAFQTNYSEQINEKLMVSGISISMPEHKIRKHKDLFNQAIRDVLEDNKSRELLMKDVILSLSDFFDPIWLKENVLDKKAIQQLEIELVDLAGAAAPKKSKKKQSAVVSK